MNLIDTALRTSGAPGLHAIPDRLIPRDPRLGGSCVPVPAERITALLRSGPVVLGLQPGFAHTDGFAESVVAELRALLALPDDHACVLVPAMPNAVSRLIARLPMATGPEPWRTADLSRTSAPMEVGALAGLDAAWFCPSWLLGTVPGCTVLTLSSAAAAAAAGAADSDPLSLPALLASDGPRPGGAEMMMLAHAVRSLAESHPERYEADVAARLELVRTRCAGLPWVAAEPYRPDRDLAAVVPTALSPADVRGATDFLERRAIAYGLADPERPAALRIGLYPTVADDDLTRLIGLMDKLFGGREGGASR